MNSPANQSNNEMADLFKSESSKLEISIHQFLKNSKELSISEIIQVYYQVTNVKSLVKFLRLNLEEKENKEQKSLMIKIKEIEKYINEHFDLSLHPLIMSNLKKLVDEYTKKLKDKTTEYGKKTKENLEIQAKMYEKLRQIMSTKEFVDQYNNGLTNPI